MITQNIEQLSRSTQDKITDRPLLTLPEPVGFKGELPIRIWNNPPSITDQPNNFSFDIAQLTPVVDQGECGSCWSFSSTAVLSDRFRLRGVDVHLSPVKPIACNFITNLQIQSVPAIQEIDTSQLQSSCYGQTLSNAWRFLYTQGTFDNKCHSLEDLKKVVQLNDKQLQDVPTELKACSHLTRAETCDDGSAKRIYSPVYIYKMSNDIAQIQQDILENGPSNASFYIYDDFYTFDPKTEVYDPNKNSVLVVGHSIRIIGWGESEKNGEYWIAANTWGPDWGMNGLFYIRKNSSFLKLEDNFFCGLPMLDPTSIQKSLWPYQNIFVSHPIDTALHLMKIDELIRPISQNKWAWDGQSASTAVIITLAVMLSILLLMFALFVITYKN